LLALGWLFSLSFSFGGNCKAVSLEQVLSEWVAPTIALHIVTAPHRARPMRVQLLIDCLARCFANASWGHQMNVDETGW